MDAADPTPQWGSILVDPKQPSLPGLKVRFLLDHLPTAGKVLEIGCGGGKILRTIAHHRPHLELHGCDVREPQDAPDVYQFRRIEGAALPYGDADFDVVLVFDVLEHVPDPAALLAEAARLLAPGGRLVAFVPVEGERVSFYELYRRLLGADVYVETKEHIQSFTHRELGRLLGAHFEVRDRTYAYHVLGQLMDASFFAATRLKTLKSYWWKDNAMYHGKKAEAGALTKTMNALLDVGNALAWAESTLLARSRLGAAGVLVECEPREAAARR